MGNACPSPRGWIRRKISHGAVWRSNSAEERSSCSKPAILSLCSKARADCFLYARSRYRLLRLLLFIGRFYETDANLIAVDPSQLATPVCFPHCRKHKEKLLQGKTFDRAAHGQFSARFRNILHCTWTLPRTVDRHQIRGEPTLEHD